MVKKLSFLLILGLWLMPFFTEAHEEMHVVSISSDHAPVHPTYRIAKYDVDTHRDHSATLEVTLEGDCTKSYNHAYCEHEVLRYHLPSDKIIFEDEKLLYIDHGHRLIIASHDRYPYFPLLREWNFFFTYATFEDNYATLNLLLYISEEPHS